MFKNISFMRILPMIVIVFFIVGMMGKGALPDILRFLISLSLYSLGILIMFWAFTQGGKKKKASPKDKKQDSENKQEKP